MWALLGKRPIKLIPEHGVELTLNVRCAVLYPLTTLLNGRGLNNLLQNPCV